MALKQIDNCYVEKIFETLEQGQAAVEEASSLQENRVNFSVKDAAFWSDFVSQFNKEYPDIYLCQYDIDPEFDGDLLDNMNLDFMITDKTLTNSTLESRVLFENKYSLFVSNKHPLAQAGRHSCSLLNYRMKHFCFAPKVTLFNKIQTNYSQSMALLLKRAWSLNIC